MAEPNAPLLLVEDDDSVRVSLELLLEHRGFEVVSARNGRDGLRKLDDMGGACLVLLDWMMPVMNGREFLEALRAHPRHADTRVLVFTAFAQTAEALPAEHIEKPVASKELYEAIRARWPELLPRPPS